MEVALAALLGQEAHLEQIPSLALLLLPEVAVVVQRLLRLLVMELMVVQVEEVLQQDRQLLELPEAETHLTPLRHKEIMVALERLLLQQEAEAAEVEQELLEAMEAVERVVLAALVLHQALAEHP